MHLLTVFIPTSFIIMLIILCVIHPIVLFKLENTQKLQTPGTAEKILHYNFTRLYLKRTENMKTQYT